MTVPALTAAGTMGICQFIKKIDFLNRKMEEKSFLKYIASCFIETDF